MPSPPCSKQAQKQVVYFTPCNNPVDRLLVQMSTFMCELSEEFKEIVIDAIMNLCLKFPMKHAPIIVFLSTVLRDEGGFGYKKAIVNALFVIVHHIPSSKECVLVSLAEFIEDCEYGALSGKVLFLIGKEATNALYLRTVYNRIILDTPTVRATAVCRLLLSHQ